MAAAYDQITIEKVVYARARARAIELLQLQPGDTVLDIGCGTGMSLHSLREGVGSDGTVVGLDLSPQMLTQARQRVERQGWNNVHLVQANAAELVELPLPAGVTSPVAALFALSLSPMPTPDAVLSAVAAALPSGARVSVLDAGTPPASTPWRWLYRTCREGKVAMAKQAG
jgi:ubiquinone/menaquinone biosynthesis C-methylase UbiE